MQIRKEKKHAKFRFSFILLFIFASFAACFALYMKSDDAIPVSSSNTEETSDINSDELYEEKTSVVNPVPKSERAQDGYFDSVLILAPEQMRGLSDYGAVPRDSLFTGDFTPSDIMTSSAVSFLTGKNCGSLYIFFGADSAASQGFDGLTQLITDINEKSDNVKIYLVSAIPLKSDNETETLTNAHIESFNSLLLKFADENSVNYLDLNTFLVGNDGKLPNNKAEAVGDRLKKDTYLEIADFLLTHIA